MAVGMLLLIIFLVVVAVGVLAVIGSALSPGSARGELREARQEATQAKTRERIATKALRAIANGAGNPIFEAQDALDQMESTYPKELN